VIFAPARLALLGVLAAAGVAALSTAAWAGDARPWDGRLVELWRWSVYLTVAAAIVLVVALAAPLDVRAIAATAAAVLTVVAVALWLRQWWLLASPSEPHGWWFFGAGERVEPVTVSVSEVQRSLRSVRSPSGHLTAAGYASGGLLLVTLAATLATLVRLAPRRVQPAG